MKETIRHRRHRDDEYWDEISVHAKYAGLGISVVPRFKTSDLSGDEWRISTKVTLSNRDGVVHEQFYGNMKGAIQFAPHILWTRGQSLLTASDATITAFRKGHTLWTGAFPTFADAVIGLPWHLIRASEGDSSWTHLSDAVERELCCQPGCEDKPVCLYRLKKIMYGDDRRTFLEPEYDFEARHRWFCARHARRGDASFEDSDKNYELIKGEPPEEAVVDARDVCRSVFAGVINLVKDKT